MLPSSILAEIGICLGVEMVERVLLASHQECFVGIELIGNLKAQ